MADMNIGDTQLILRKCQQYGLLRNQTAYVLATAFWETGRTMEPVREAYGSSAEQSIARLDNAWAKGQLSWVSKPYWREGFFGRGYVQLTHEYNYAKAGQAIGADLVQEPDRALDPDIASEILVCGMRDGWFTGKKLGDYITLQRSDFIGARRVVNGTDKASVISKLVQGYDAELKRMGYGEEPETEAAPPAAPAPAARPSEPIPTPAPEGKAPPMLGTAGLAARIILYALSGDVALSGVDVDVEAGTLTLNVENLLNILIGTGMIGGTLAWRKLAASMGGML